MILKEKRDGVIKGRYCADGRHQRLWKLKKDTTSPTVSLEAIFLTALIDAMENQHVAISDIPGAFLSADIDEIVIMVIEGELLEVLLKEDKKKYLPYVTKNRRGDNIIYVKLQKAL